VLPSIPSVARYCLFLSDTLITGPVILGTARLVFSRGREVVLVEHNGIAEIQVFVDGQEAAK
jgi:hypothetical protein